MRARGRRPQSMRWGFSRRALVTRAVVPRSVPRMVCGRVNFQAELTKWRMLNCSEASSCGAAPPELSVGHDDDAAEDVVMTVVRLVLE